MFEDDTDSRFGSDRGRSRRFFVGALGAAGLGLTVGSMSTATGEPDGATGGEGDGSDPGAADDADDGADSEGSEPVEIDSCTVIDEPGEYELVADLAPETLEQPACIVIDSEDVTLRGNGHTVDVSDARSQPGSDDVDCVAVHPEEDREVHWDTVVEDLAVRGGRAGISAQLSDRGEYRDVTATGNDYGFHFFVDGGTLANCVAADNDEAGVFVGGEENVWGGLRAELNHCTLESNGRGLWIGHESGATVRNSRIVGNDEGVRTSPVAQGGRIEDSHVCSNEEVGVYAGTDAGYDEDDESQPPREGSVTAVDNYWGAANGPSSYGDPEEPYEDPETGEPADGDGDAVTESLEPGVSNVRFDPFREGPIDGVGADR